MGETKRTFFRVESMHIKHADRGWFTAFIDEFEPAEFEEEVKMQTEIKKLRGEALGKFYDYRGVRVIETTEVVYE